MDRLHKLRFCGVMAAFLPVEEAVRVRFSSGPLGGLEMATITITVEDVTEDQLRKAVNRAVKNLKKSKQPQPNSKGYCACPEHKQKWVWRPGSYSECGRCGGILI
jgi:hypothetical protein